MTPLISSRSVETGFLRRDFDFHAEYRHIRDLMRRYRERPMSFADACLVRMAELRRLAFEREPLRYVIEDVNRYAAKPIVIGDESIGELRITGTVVDHNVGGWVASLESAFGLRAVEERERIVLRRGS